MREGRGRQEDGGVGPASLGFFGFFSFFFGGFGDVGFEFRAKRFGA